ncbi:MAG: hypothetical protein ACRDS0_23795 [Pseudonocardiaceae bacterium]
MEELVATLQGAVSIDNLWPVSQLLVEWRHTAEIYAEPLRGVSPKRRTDLVPR